MMDEDVIENLLPNMLKIEWNERFDSSSDSDKIDMLRIELTRVEMMVKQIDNVFQIMKNYI